MQRIPEPELMDNADQARAYAEADFEQPHARFVELFRQEFPRNDIHGRVLDLGCGPCDISCRMAGSYTACTIDAVDGSAAMLSHGRERVSRHGLGGRIHLYQRYLPDDPLPSPAYGTIISNSLLHHLASAQTLWRTIQRAAAPAAVIFVMDLMRPASRKQARRLVAEYAAQEPPVLQHDFYHSLLAAYTVEEIRTQLTMAGLHGLQVQAVSDRHLIVSGHAVSLDRIPGAGLQR